MKKGLFTMLMAASCALTLSSCSPTFDKDKPQESVQEMLKDLPADKQHEFHKAMFKIGFSVCLTNAALGASFDSISAEVLEVLDGKTVDEIIEYAQGL